MLICFLNYVVLMLSIGFSVGKSASAVLKLMRLVQTVLLFADFAGVVLFKTEFEQQSLPVLAVLLSLLVPGRARLETDDISQDPSSDERRSFGLLKKLYRLEDEKITSTALTRLRVFLESDVLAIQTRAAIVARREAERELWEAVRVCGMARAAGQRISVIRRVVIFINFNLFYIFVLGSIIALRKHDLAFFIEGGMELGFPLYVSLCWLQFCCGSYLRPHF